MRPGPPGQSGLPLPHGPPPPGAGYPAPIRPYNTLAVVAIVLTFFFAPAGLICGIIAAVQARKRDEGGFGLAVTAIILSTAWLLLLVAFIAWIAVAASGDSRSA